MKVAFTGYSGFIASSIRKEWENKGFEFFNLRRQGTDDNWLTILSKSDVVINLAGAPVIQRWTTRNMEAIVRSRVDTTQRLVELLNKSDLQKEVSLISASAIGIYPDKGETTHDEFSQQTGSDFLSNVVIKWEEAAQKISNPKVRLVQPRIGIVLGREGGLLKKVMPLFKLGLGGRIATGKQAMSFIHIQDIVSAFQFFVENKKTKGVYNLVTPNWITNKQFTLALSRRLKRPALLTVPAFALKLLYGKAANIMINGEKVAPERLLKAGYTFKFPTIGACLIRL